MIRIRQDLSITNIIDSSQHSWKGRFSKAEENRCPGQQMAHSLSKCHTHKSLQFRKQTRWAPWCGAHRQSPRGDWGHGHEREGFITGESRALKFTSFGPSWVARRIWWFSSHVNRSATAVKTVPWSSEHQQGLHRMQCLSSKSFSVGTWGKRGPKAEAVTPGALVPIAGNEVWSAPLPLLPLDGRCGSSYCLSAPFVSIISSAFLFRS